MTLVDFDQKPRGLPPMWLKKGSVRPLDWSGVDHPSQARTEVTQGGSLFVLGGLGVMVLVAGVLSLPKRKEEPPAPPSVVVEEIPQSQPQARVVDPEPTTPPVQESPPPKVETPEVVTPPLTATPDRVKLPAGTIMKTDLEEVERLARLGQSKTLTADDLNGVPKPLYRFIRNGLYALHGGKFKAPELTDWFKRYSWYTPTKEAAQIELPKLEVDNATFLQNLEKS